MEAMSMSMSCKSARKERKGKRAMDKEKKKKILSERRKILNVDHLQTDKLMEKIREIYDWYVYTTLLLRYFLSTIFWIYAIIGYDSKRIAYYRRLHKGSVSR